MVGVVVGEDPVHYTIVARVRSLGYILSYWRVFELVDVAFKVCGGLQR
jgi:hypothetical protein